MEQKLTLVKVIIIGHGQSGKTSLVTTASGKEFTEKYRATIGMDFITFPFEGRYNIQLWDTAGQERFQAITTAFYKGAKVICIVYSVVDKESFNQVENKLKEAKEHCEPSTQFILIGTKNDLPDRKVYYDEGQSMANKHDMLFLETSAKTDSPQVFTSKLGEAADKYFLLNPPTPEA